MLIPRFFYFYLPAFLVECALLCMWVAEPIHASRALGASPLALGVMGLASAGYALVALLTGYLSDRTGRLRWMLLGAVMQIVMGLVLPLCRDRWSFITLCILHMTTLGFFWTPFMSRFSEATPPSRLSAALGLYNISWCSGGIVGSVLSGALYDRLGPAAPFYAGAAFMVLPVLIFIFCRPRPLAGGSHVHPVTSPQAPLYLRQARLVMALAFFAVNLLVYIFPKLAEAPELRLSASQISLLHGTRMTATLLAFAAMGATVRWHFRAYPIQLCFGLLSGMMLLMVLLRAPGWFVLPFAAVGLATGLGYGLSAYYSMMAPTGKGSVVGKHEALLALGAMLGPVFGGLIMNASGQPRTPYLAALLPLALLWLVCLAIQRRLWMAERAQPHANLHG